MPIITVNGAIEPRQLGITSVHEHLFIDLSWAVKEPKDVLMKKLFYGKVEMKNLGILRRMPLAVKDNFILDDAELMEEELLEFKRAGGDSIVELSCRGFNLDPAALRKLSRAVGVNIIASTGFYTKALHPLGMGEMTVEDIENILFDDINTGINGTGVKAGVMGELGVSTPIHPDEKKVLTAAAHVSKQTGVAMMLHIPGDEKEDGVHIGLRAIDIITEAGGDIRKVAIAHADSPLKIDVEYCIKVLEKGAYLTFDSYNHEQYVAKKDRPLYGGACSSDYQRVIVTKHLIDRGFAAKILIGQDTCFKTMCHRYGGYGLDHMITNIIPMMQDEGITDNEIKAMYIDNPRNWLDSGRP